MPIKTSLPIEKSRDEILQADLCIPTDPKGLVIFSHGSGSGRHSPRNKYVAEALSEDGLATLLVDLLTQEEEQADIRAQKIQCKIPGLMLWQNSDTRSLILGYFGASTGTAAALIAAGTITGPIKNQNQRQAVERPAGKLALGAIVSRSGRPDLAGVEYLKT
jgi:putative phosphoribosyl transferase